MRISPTTRTLFAAALLAVFCLGAKAEAQVSLDKAAAMLDSSDRETVANGIQNLGLLGKAAAVPPLLRRIRRGLPPDLLELSIMTLTALGQKDAGPMLFELAMHRRPLIRTRAVEAIASINPPGAESALVAALSDSDAQVRAAAATGLGEVGTKASLDTLFHALDRGVMEAATAIGKVIPADQVDRLLGYLDQIPFRSLSPAFDQVLSREDVSEKAKLKVIAGLQDLATSEIKGYLVDFLSSAGETASPAIIRAVRSAVQLIAD
jgi:HEAT repeat protein